MDLLTAIVVLAVIGFALWLVLTYIPMPEPFKQVILVIVVLLLLVFVVRTLIGGGPIVLRRP